MWCSRFKNLFVFAAVFLGCPYLLVAQKVNEDSLLQVIQNSKADTARIDALLALANYQVKHKMQVSIGFKTLDEAKRLSQQHGYTKGLVQVLLTTGNYFRSKNEWTKSMDSYNEMIRLSAEIRNDSLRNRSLMMGYNNLGGIYNINGDFNNSLSYRLKAMEIVEKSTPSNYNNLAVVYLNIASDYRQLKLHPKAIEYLNKTRRFFAELSGPMKMEYYYEYYENYLASENSREAELQLEKIATGLGTFSLSPFQQKDYAAMLAKLRGNYEMLHHKNYGVAIQYYQDQLNISRELGRKGDIAESLTRIGENHLLLKNTSAALKFLQEAYDSTVSAGLTSQQRKAALLLGDAFQLSGNAGRAAFYLKKSVELTEKIYDEGKTEELNFLEAKYQHEKREKEITDLTLSNTEKELVIVKRNRLLLAGGGAGAGLLLVMGLLYRNSSQKRVIAEKERSLQEEKVRFLEGQQQVVSLQSMINGQETERTRIAKDLHDGLGGLFSTIKMHFSALKHEKPELESHEVFAKSYDMVNSASEEIRRIAHNMMPEVLIKLGLIQAVQELCNSISAGKLLQVNMQAYGMEKRLNASTEIMLFRIIQELLNNIIKHAHATEAIIQFNREGGRLSITVEDNGRGFDLQEDDGKGHAGLDSVKSRVNYLNGKLLIDSQKEAGTTVMMDFLINE